MIKDNVILINYTQVGKWLKNNRSSTKRKAMFLYREGLDFNYIVKKLNLNKNEFCRWIMESFDCEQPEIIVQENKHFKSPENYSSWNSNKIYTHWKNTAMKRVKSI